MMDAGGLSSNSKPITKSPALPSLYKVRNAADP